MNSTTPRSDAVWETWQMDPADPVEVVPLEFARQLELELAWCEKLIRDQADALERDAKDVERYRWFRVQRADRKIVITEMSGDGANMLDHFIDKGRCGL